METIKDILREMRDGVKDAHGNRVGIYDDFADQIEEAAKQMEIARIADIARECAKVKAECDAENARLKAALKPVLEVETSGDRDIYDWSRMFIDAVFEAKRIYHEGTKNEDR